MSTEIKQVSCPTCKKKVAWTEKNPARPFCSKKCQLIDFGDWASERNTIPVVGPMDDFNLDGFGLDQVDLDDVDLDDLDLDSTSK